MIPIEGFPIAEIVWTILVFLSGYLFGRLRFRRNNDLTGPPANLSRNHISTRTTTHRQSHGAPPRLSADLAEWADLDPETEAAINHALASGNKIEAIKIVREATGQGLRESKNVIDRWR